MEIIKSPINYTGNKYRIMNQIESLFPKKIKVVLDMFSGGCTVGLNIECDKVIFVDSNKRIVDLMFFLSKQNYDCFVIELEKIIDYYGLSYSAKYGYKKYRNNLTDNNGLKDYNYNAFYKMRSDYNNLKNKNTSKGNTLLYLLMIYGFNNDIRFNSNGMFNLPVGKTDLNKLNLLKLKKYMDRIKEREYLFICANYDDISIEKYIEEADFIYMDPPYLIGNAVYNTGWKKDNEIKLLKFIDLLIKKEKNFALSNLIDNNGYENIILKDWVSNSKFVSMHMIDYHYRSASYNKRNRNDNEQEVLITNKEYI